MQTLKKKICNSSPQKAFWEVLLVFSFMLAPNAASSAEQPAELIDVRAVYGDAFSSIVFQFDQDVEVEALETGKNYIDFTFRDSETALDAFRKFPAVDASVRLEKTGSDLTARIGLPKDLLKFSHYRIRTQNTWIIKFYKADASRRPPSETPVLEKATDPGPDASESYEASSNDPLIKPGSKTSEESPFVAEKSDPRNRVKADGLLTLNFYQSDIQEILSALAMEREMNIVTAQEVSGRVSVHLYQVTLDEALNAIALAGGFKYRKHQGLCYIYKPKAVPDPQSEERRMKIFKLRYADTAKVGELLKAMPNSGSIQAHDPSRTIIVEDTPVNILKMEAIIGHWDQLPKQVVIEAKILEVSLTDDMAFGVDWSKILGEFRIGTGGFSRATLPTTEPVAPDPGTGAGVFANMITAIGTNHQFALALDALKVKTRVETLSTPKVLAIHGKSAKVQVGGQQGYRVTTSNLGVATETIEFIDTGTILEITPFIDDDGRILLNVLPSIQDARLDNGIPVVRSTTVATWLMAKSGETVFIGGLIKDKKEKTRDTIPCLGDIPALGALVGRSTRSFNKTELVVLITPQILGESLTYAETKEKEKVKKAEEAMSREPLPPVEQIEDLISPIR